MIGLSRQGLADALGCDPSKVSRARDRLAEAGAVHPDGSFDLARARELLGPTRAYGPRVTGGASRDGGDAGEWAETYAEAKRREAAAKATRAEIEVAQLQGRLIDRAAAEREVEALASDLRQRLLVALADAAERLGWERADRDRLADVAEGVFGAMAGELERRLDAAD